MCSKLHVFGDVVTVSAVTPNFNWIFQSNSRLWSSGDGVKLKVHWFNAMCCSKCKCNIRKKAETFRNVFVLKCFLKCVRKFCFFFLQHWEVFKKVTEVFILVPALLGLKGNLEMTLASRLSTAVSFCLPQSMYITYAVSIKESLCQGKFFSSVYMINFWTSVLC